MITLLKEMPESVQKEVEKIENEMLKELRERGLKISNKKGESWDLIVERFRNQVGLDFEKFITEAKVNQSKEFQKHLETMNAFHQYNIQTSKAKALRYVLTYQVQSSSFTMKATLVGEGERQLKEENWQWLFEKNGYGVEVEKYKLKKMFDERAALEIFSETFSAISDKYSESRRWMEELVSNEMVEIMLNAQKEVIKIRKRNEASKQ